MTMHMITCDQFAELLADYLEGTLDGGARATVELHVASCAACAALAADLEAIRRQAAALATLAPTRDLWAGIEDRIQAPVVALEEARGVGSGGVPRARGRLPWWGLAAAAAALVVASSGVTYRIAVTHAERQAAEQYAQAQQDRSLGPAPADALATERQAPDAVVATSADSGADPGKESELAQSSDAGPGAPTRLASSRQAPVVGTHDREIAQLRAAVAQRRAELDTTTISVIEENLRVIDRAIAQSRAALTRDPGSGFLNQQINEMLDKKVELLRTAAMLPART
ncbi:MAG: zf-HC2 domain-containing protein [Gemmatimonadota bacterium]|nr:zf-HC2 domain-containing protein [Gemmatimonadota bacterium]